MERGNRKRTSSAGSEKMERVGSRLEKMEGHCSTGQSPQWAIVSMEEEEEDTTIMAKDKLVRSPRENGGGQDVRNDLHSRTGRDEKKGKTQEKMERGSRKRSSSAGSEKMERVGGR